MKKILLSVFLVTFLLGTNVLKAQMSVNSSDAIHDSLAGFNENKFISSQVSEGVSGNRLKKALSVAKKEFIHEKYFHNHNANMVWKTAQTNSVNPGCTNMDFEAGSFAGWSISRGTNSNSTTMAGCCTITTGIVSAVIPGTGNDPVCGGLLPLTSPFGGNNIARINDVNTGARVERLSQSFNVTSSNAIFQLAYAGVLENAAHSCADQPFINISVIDSSGNVLFCPKIDIAAPSNLCTQPTSVTAGWTPYTNPSTFDDVFYHTWDIKTIDLSPYIGTSITIQITVGDCAQTGHYGYGYFDCRCNPLEISLNGVIFDATPQTPIDVSMCGALNATLIAPLGLNPYLWNGPAGSGVTGVTTQSMVTSTPATYTLTMDPPGSCYGPITKYIILHATPNPTVSNITAQATCTNATGSGTINVVSGSSPFTYNWLPAATTTSLGSGLSPGVDYTVTVVDTFGCQGATVLSIASFTNGPTYTITPLSANLSCTSSSLTASAITGTNTTAVWTHTNTSNFDVTAPGTYSCVVTNTLSLCTATVPITITSNTVAPVATYTMLCNGSTVSLNANSTSGVALGWLAPTLPSPSPISNPGTSTAAGIYTLTATNLGTGCQSTYTVESLVPTLNILTSPSNQLTCITSSLQSIASSSTSSATITWFNGSTTSPLDTLVILAAGSYTATASLVGGCSTQSVITITTNTTVGANINAPTTVLSCITNTITLTAAPTSTGVYNYTWTPSASTATNTTYAVTTPGTYTLDMLNTTNGCTATNTIVITSNVVLPTATYSVLCGTFPATLSATSTFSAPVNISWITPTTPTTAVANNGTSTASGIFTVVVTNPTTGCVNTYTIQSLVPQLTTATSPANNIITCNNPTITATATSTTPGTMNITWLNGTTTSTVNPYPITASGSYTVNIQPAGGGCSTQSVVTVTTNTAVGVSISTPSTIISCATNSLALTASGTTANPYTYTWSPSPPTYTNSIYNVSVGGTYTVVAMNTTNGCTATATQAVTHETINASFVADPYQGLMPLPVSFTNTSTGNPVGTVYDWDLGNGMTYTTTVASTIYNAQGNYQVVLTATAGFCTDTAVRIIKVDLVSLFTVPNVFTPNGDGKNDVFTFDAINMGEITLTVFDRWGLKMFESTNTGNIKWDGKNKGGSTVTDGTYFYIIKATGLDDVKYDLQGTINVFQ